MPDFEPGDVVKVPFPCTDKATRQRRPVLVVAAGKLQQAHGLLWVLMITSAENRGWPGDVAITALSKAGLPVPSVVRTAKIATIETRDAEPLGKLTPSTFADVRRQVAAALEFPADQEK
jgi:mRNA interferase MazF